MIGFQYHQSRQGRLPVRVRTQTGRLYSIQTKPKEENGPPPGKEATRPKHSLFFHQRYYGQGVGHPAGRDGVVVLFV